MSSPADSPPSLSSVIQKLLDKSPLDRFVKCVVDLTSVPPYKAPRVALLHVRFKEDAPSIRAFSDFLGNQAANYALSRRRRDAYQAQMASAENGDVSAAQELSRAVRKAFIEFRKANPSRASEVGEVLAYCVAVHHLQASQLIAKMALKTSNNMPVYGLDGIHASVVNGELNVFFLESKLAGTAASGTADYAESVSGFLKDDGQYEHEYGLVTSLGNLDVLEQADKDLMLNYLDVFGNPNAPKRERSVGVVCYSEVKHFANKLEVDDGPLSKHEDYFGELYKGDLNRHFTNLNNQLGVKGVDPNKCMVYLVAVPDIDELREMFYESIGIGSLDSDVPLTPPSATESAEV
ncbi:uncharacterized protein DUF1837 [Pseudomonas sp. AG1028]|uniref:HamA C-terminal domain-containing protein n=1 Tax=Pseudomonas sp. AG1028 TaxID=2572911 RepID=UPI0011AC9517|nr:DUF1837 domain-containing protein [Pseudomonas sp. AG1028]TWE07770.1 uncharacterized protein DUF1837 [Pseudomonas sp. AG1028]